MSILYPFLFPIFFIIISLIIFHLIFKNNILTKIKKILMVLNTIFLVLNILALFALCVLFFISNYFIGPDFLINQM